MIAELRVLMAGRLRHLKNISQNNKLWFMPWKVIHR